MSKRADQKIFKYPLFKVSMSKNVSEEVSKTLLSGKISQYSKVSDFEKKLSNYIGNSNLLTVNSGTSALHLAYHLLKKPLNELNFPGLEDGDEVLTTPLTCTATNWPILANNLKIKWVDIDPNNMNLNLNDLKNKLSKKTKIISVVHWGGTPLNLNKLRSICDYAEKTFGFRPMVIEDGAHSFGAEYDGKKLGNHGNIVMHSFQAIKHLTTVDGGLLILPSQELYERGKLIRWFGISRERKNNKQKDFRVEDDIKEWGFKFHMNDVNATIGLSNFQLSIENLKIHRRNANYYDKELQNLKNIELIKINDNITSAYWLYTFKINNRESFINFMTNKGICVSQVHGRNDIHTCVKEFVTTLPILDEYYEKVICIPVGWWLTEEDIRFIVECIKEWDKIII
jgi:dTDP-4-amino-4,6-dideoxygalactose transaminase